MKLRNIFKRKTKITAAATPNTKKSKVTGIAPGRVSTPDDPTNFIYAMKGFTQLVDPSFRVEVIQILRDLYKINPDVSIALQDMFKLANTGHIITFPNNTDAEAEKMRNHIRDSSKNWSQYTAGIDGLVNKMIVQLIISGAISVEAVPNQNLDGLDTILFVKPDNIRFKRENNGVYKPYQRNTNFLAKQQDYIPLNPLTYVYAGMYNDTDEPYGIPLFMASLDSLKGQHDMKINFKHIMEQVGMLGFLEAKVAKPSQKGGESENAYASRLTNNLKNLKTNLVDGMKDGVVTGYIDDYDFKLNSTTKELGNIDKVWSMNQQSVANGLGVNGGIIGVNANTSDTGSSIMLSKMISQLKIIQKIVGYVLDFIYSLDLRLAGFNNKGIRITWSSTTVADDVKVQQALQYKIQNLNYLYNAGIISQSQYAWEMGYDSPDQKKPRVMSGQSNDPQEATKKDQRQGDKNQSARRTRDKNNPNPKRGDQDTRTR